MKGFYISVKNDLLEPKHYQNMGEAIWLYMWLLDKMTSITETGVGSVLGGRPVTTEDLQVELGLPVRTYRRYVSRLVKHGYVRTKRSPHGLIFTISKASKPFKRSAKNGTSKTKSDVPHLYSDVPNMSRDVPNRHMYIDNNKTIQDNNKNADLKLREKEQAAMNRKSTESQVGYKQAQSIADALRIRQNRLKK